MEEKDIERLRALVSPDAELLSDSYRLTEIIKLDPIKMLLTVEAQEREACAQTAERLIEERRGLSLSFDMIATAIRARH